GVQVLFAFLLAVPFANDFPKVSETSRDVFYGAFVATALSTALLIAPSSYHRLRWRQHDKERMLGVSKRADDRGALPVSRSRRPGVWPQSPAPAFSVRGRRGSPLSPPRLS